MTGKFRWTREIPPASEWFDLDRSEKTMASNLQEPINEQFAKIEEILRDEAHEGIGEAIHDLHNLVHKLLLRYQSIQNIMDAQQAKLLSDEFDEK